MKNPIFVFSDDLDIFENSQVAEGYIEPWLLERKILAFDSDGRVLNCRLEKRPCKFLWGIFCGSVESVRIDPSQRICSEDFRAQLVSYLQRLAERSGSKASPNLAQESLAVLVKTAVEVKGYTW